MIEPILERVEAFSDGVAAAQRDKRWGYIGKNGKWKIGPKYLWVRSFRNGLALAGEAHGRGNNVDQSGRVVWKSSN